MRRGKGVGGCFGSCLVYCLGCFWRLRRRGKIDEEDEEGKKGIGREKKSEKNVSKGEIEKMREKRPTQPVNTVDSHYRPNRFLPARPECVLDNVP